MHIHIQLKTYTGIPRSSAVKHTLIGLLDRGLIFFQIGTNTKSMKSTVQLKSDVSYTLRLYVLIHVYGSILIQIYFVVTCCDC